MTPTFIYFDLGRVLVEFDVGLMCQQVGRVAGLEPAQVAAVLYDDGLQQRYELGRMSTAEFYEAFCQRTGTRPPMDALLRAASDIFHLNRDTVPIVENLYRAGYPLGILSNTCCCHWEHCAQRFPLLTEAFGVFALSYRVGAAKPDPALYLAAARLAGVEPNQIFFTDDIPANVEGARAVGFDAVRFTTAEALVSDLEARGVRLDRRS